MSQDRQKRPTYPGGIETVLSRMEGRRDALSSAGEEGLPPADLDLLPLLSAVVGDPDDDPAEAPPFRSAYHRKRHALRKELTGAPELVYLHGMVVAHLRKRDFPAWAPLLFQRLWTEQGPQLLGALDPRWQVSAITTFGDHGITPVQRSVGLALGVLFGTMKLYESERLYSGLPPDRPFPLGSKARARLPMDMDAYALADGGLDVNLLGRLWREAEGDEVIRPLAHALLDRLIHDDRTLFRRLMTMRARQEKRSAESAHSSGAVAPVPGAARRVTADTLRWGIVSTIRAPLRDIARFAAHHLELGATALHIHLDRPDHAAAAYLSRHPAIRVIQCDETYWQASGKARMDAHQLRQVHNATRILHRTGEELDWLGHLDVDEFLLTARPVRELLAELPSATAFARILPAEALATTNGFPVHYKLANHHAGAARSAVEEIYPTFGPHLRGGLLSHTAGKLFARPGIPGTRFGIHRLKYRGEEAENGTRLDGIRLGHHHAPNWERFRTHLDFRRNRGSYRPRPDRKEMGQAALLDFLREEEGETGLRMFFEEVCADTHALRERLAAHDMLLRFPLDPDSAVARVFGRVP